MAASNSYMITHLLNKVKELEGRVNHLEKSNQKLENIIKQSFMSFKFNKEAENETLIKRLRMKL